jgi:ribosome biogenesis GTPase / thiamine phosphate phosphatase
MMSRARIFRSSKRHFDCLIENTKDIVQATALASLLREDHLVVGDWVLISPPPQGGEEWIIHEIVPRKNSIFRNIPRENKKKVIAANVDVMMLVVSAERPAYKRGIIDRYLARADYWDVPSFLIFNKMDLYDPTEFDIQFEADRLKWLDVQCFEISAQSKDYKPRYLAQGFKELDEQLKGKTAVLVGHSGVGKSRLITELSNGMVNLLSGELGKGSKGAHTTTWAELIDAEEFSLIDSPGIRSMSLSDLTQEELLQGFSDVQEWATKCQFASNCHHDERSKNCFFQKLSGEAREDQLILSRLESYQRILSEVQDIPDWSKKPNGRY